LSLMDMKVMDFRRQVDHLPRLMDRAPTWSERQADEDVGRIEGRHRDLRSRDYGPSLVDLLVAETERSIGIGWIISAEEAPAATAIRQRLAGGRRRCSCRGIGSRSKDTAGGENSPGLAADLHEVLRRAGLCKLDAQEIHIGPEFPRGA